MNARRDSSDEPEAGSSGGRALLVGAVVFAAIATGVLVLSDEQKWLRLGIVAALWAALVGAFLAAKYRRQLADQESVAADRQELYELELEREVAARREYELELAADVKRQAEEESRDDIAALRGELQTLRQTLESLLGGEFLVERYALRAESTRMRSLPEDRTFAPRSDLKRLTAAEAKEDIVPPIVREAETELIERIREVHHKPRREPQPQREPAPPRPEPRVETRSDARPPTLPRRAERPARTEWPTPEPVKPLKPVKPAQPVQRAEPAPRAEEQPPNRYVEHPAELSDRWFIPEGLGDQLPPPRQAPSAARREEYDPAMQFGTPAEQTSWLAQYNKPGHGQQNGEPTYSSRAYVQPVRPEPPQLPPEPALTDRPSRRAAEFHEEPAPTGRRHRVEEEPETGGGRRRRAEGQPSWQETVGRGGHAQADEPSGSHASGRSVNELLANHGIDSSPRRRRRRED
jgi:hypothetical protein